MDLPTLRQLRQCPEGSAEAWTARYAGQVEEFRNHLAAPLTPRVSVIVVGFRRPSALLRCLDRVWSQRSLAQSELEVILVNNGGLDPAERGLPARVHTELRMRGNLGLCRARNLGAALARGPILAFLDDDGLIAPDYLGNALRYFEDPQVIALRGRIVARSHRYFTTFARHYDRGPHPLDDNIVTEGNSLHRRAPFIKVGGFAETLPRHEGLDYSYRLRVGFPGARLLYAPDVLMQHDYADSVRRFLTKTSLGATTQSLIPAFDSEFHAFIAHYSAREFPRVRRRWDEQIAGLLLRGSAALLGFPLRARRARFNRP